MDREIDAKEHKELEETHAYEMSMKMRKLIEDNFNIVTASDTMETHPVFGSARWATVRTTDGLLIKYQGEWFTNEEREEIRRDHIEGDTM